jgi:hypothetical protein
MTIALSGRGDEKQGSARACIQSGRLGTIASPQAQLADEGAITQASLATVEAELNRKPAVRPCCPAPKFWL